jgi:FAD/FMN-containing dehydrogenase
MQDLIANLRELLEPSAVLTGEQLGGKYSVDYTAENPHAPLAVLRPKTTEEVAEIMRACHAAAQPVVIQGGLTGLSGGATPRPGEIALSLDFGARGSCHIGGAIATNAGGNQVIRFGMARNLVLGLEAVLADGTVISSMSTMLKNNAGYDLKQLFVGTEGTLGIITRCALRLYPRLPSRATALCALETFGDAVGLLGASRRHMTNSLSAFEVMWAPYFDYVTEHVDHCDSPFDKRHPIYALMEVEGTDDETDNARLETLLSEAFDTGAVVDAVVAQSEAQREAVWAIRDGIAEIARLLTPYASLDVSLELDRMQAFLHDIETALKKAFPDVLILVFGHFGDSNLHVFVTTKRHEDLEQIHEITYGLTGRYGGSISAEHGIGQLKTGYLHHSRSPAELALMSTLKAALDPLDILNSGRVLEVGDARAP